MKNYLIVIFVLFSIAFSACNQEPKVDEPEKTKSEMKVEKTDEILIENTWIRVGAKGRNTAMFMNIINGTEFDDTLLSAESNASVLVEVHETFESENEMMGMRKVESVVIPSMKKVSLKPRGLHVMFITLNKDVVPGDTISATLNFAQAGAIDILAIAKEMDMKKINH